jgi:hypothetical protein
MTTGAGLISGIRSALSQTNYVDNQARTPGSGIAWTAESLADGSLKCTPVSNAHNMLVHFAAQAQTSTSTPMAFGETRGAAGERVYTTMVLNPGAYSLATTATPWGSDFNTKVFGYVIASPFYNTNIGMSSSQNVSSIKIYESKDALLVLLTGGVRHSSGYNATVTVTMPLMFGGFVEPLTDDLLDAESDGILYGMCTYGGVGVTGSNFRSLFSGFHTYSAFLSHSANGSLGCIEGSTKSGSHAGIFRPGSSLTRTFAMSGRLNTGMQTLSNKLVKSPIYIGNSTYLYGRVRGMSFYKSGLANSVLNTNNQNIGFIVGFFPGGAYDALLLDI